MQKNDFNKFVGGVVGGINSCIICSPMDVIKTRIQTGFFNPFKPTVHIPEMYRKEGIFSFYKGASGSFLAIPLFWGLYFPLYDKNKQILNNVSLAGFVSGAMSSFITNPFWVVRTRLQTQEFYPDRNYKNVFDCLKQLVVKEGIRSWYSGYTLTLISNSQFLISMPIYERIKKPENNFSIIYASAISKIISGAILYPHDVIRSNARNTNKRIKNVILDLFQSEGIFGFYRGFTVYTLRGIPFSISIFLTYELKTKF